MKDIVSVDHLRVEFATDSGPVVGVEDVSFTIAPGETVALVGRGESAEAVAALADDDRSAAAGDEGGRDESGEAATDHDDVGRCFRCRRWGRWGRWGVALCHAPPDDAAEPNVTLRQGAPRGECGWGTVLLRSCVAFSTRVRMSHS